MTAKFKLGHVVSTQGALSMMASANILPLVLLQRHVRGDWGDLEEDDKQANEDALRDGNRLLSSYKIVPDQKVWIITEADRSSTTLLLPEEY